VPHKPLHQFYERVIVVKTVILVAIPSTIPYLINIFPLGIKKKSLL
jgi:hypothetical protein